MSTSLLYHAFGFIGYHYVKTDYKDGTVLFSIARKADKLCCPACDSKRIIRRGFFARWGFSSCFAFV